MIIKYKNRIKNTDLFLGVLWMLLPLSYIIFSKDKTNWLFYGHLVLGLFYFCQYYFKVRYEYARIEGDYLIKSRALIEDEKINLREVSVAKRYKDKYLFKANELKFRLDLQRIDPDSLNDLNEYLKGYQILGIEC